MQSRSTRRAVIAGLALSVFVVAASSSTSHLTAQFSFESLMQSLEQWRSQNFSTAPSTETLVEPSLQGNEWDSTADQLPQPTLGIPTSTTQTPPINPVTGYPQGTSGDFSCKGCVVGVNCPANCQDVLQVSAPTMTIRCAELDPNKHAAGGIVLTYIDQNGNVINTETKGETCSSDNKVHEWYCIPGEQCNNYYAQFGGTMTPATATSHGYVEVDEQCNDPTPVCPGPTYDIHGTQIPDGQCVSFDEQGVVHGMGDELGTDTRDPACIAAGGGPGAGGNGIGAVGNGGMPGGLVIENGNTITQNIIPPSGTEGMQFPWQQFAAPAQNVLDQQNGVTVNDPMRGILYPAAGSEEPCPPVDGDVPQGGDEAVVNVGGREVRFSTQQGLVAARAVSIPAGAPEDTEFPMGMFGVVLRDVTPGGSVVVRLSGAPQNATGYTKYGPTAENSAHHFYDFAYDGTTGAKVQNGVIELHFVDGGRGDADLQANGIIVDPGGPTGPRGGGSPSGGPRPPPPRAQCGNGIREGAEQCDDGKNNGTEASNCTKNCQLKQQPCDLCTSYTTKEKCNDPGRTCMWIQNACQKGPYCPGPATCGNGKKDEGEQCDVQGPGGTNEGPDGYCGSNCRYNALYCSTCTRLAKNKCKAPCAWSLGCYPSDQYCPVVDQKCQNAQCKNTFRYSSNPFELTASTNGARAGFTANDADLGVYEYPLIAGNGRVDVASTSSEFNGDPGRPVQGSQIATDANGSTIAFMGGSASYMQNKTLFVFDSIKRKLFQIANQGGLPSLSADGKKLAYIDYGKALHLYNRETGEDKVLEGTSRNIVEVALRPDGQRAVYLKETNNHSNTTLHLVNLEDGTHRQLALDESITSRMRIQGEETLYYKGNTVLVQTPSGESEGIHPLVCDTEARSTKCARIKNPGYYIRYFMGLSDDESKMLVKRENSKTREDVELVILGTRSSFEKVVFKVPNDWRGVSWHKMNARLSGDGNAVVAIIPIENSQELQVIRIDVATSQQTVLFAPRFNCTTADKEPRACDSGGGTEDIRCNAGETCVQDGTAFNCLIGTPTNGARCRLSGKDGTCKKCPTSNECDKKECGPALGMPNWQCADGSGTGGPTGRCLRNASGKCGWEINNCPKSVCGNKKVETGEECDDGNTTNGDGCSSTCKKEGTGQSGWYDPDLLDISRATTISYNGFPSGNKDKCRDGTDAFIEEQYTPDATTTPKGYTEQCPLYTKCLEGACLGKGPTPTADEAKCTDSDDDVSKPYRGFNIFVAGTAKRGTSTDSDACYTTNIGTHLQETYCRRDGQIAHLTVRCPKDMECREGACVGGHSSAPVCGNGKLESPEECDDGNTKDGDGCSSTCKKEVRAADLSIELSAPASVQQGTNLAYTLTVRNAGPSAAEGIETVLGVPSNVTIVSGETDTLCKKEENSIRCKPFTLQKNGSKTLKIVIGTSTFACNATLDQRAKVGSPVPDPNTGNNQSNAVHIDITCSSGGADLSIVMRAPQTVQTQEFEYQLDVKNAGPEDVMNDKVIVTLAGLQAVSTLKTQTPNANCSLAGGQVNCRLSLKKLQQVTLKLKVGVHSSYCGVMFNRAYVSGSQDPNQANNSSPTDIKGQQIYVCPNSSPVCGNSKVESPEECDDGNTKDGDGCSSTCKKESSNPVCGNGKKEGTEECDDGNKSNTDSCTNYCKNARCGDAFVQPPEECDWNGNRGCSKQCKAIPIHFREAEGLRIATSENGQAVLVDSKAYPNNSIYATWFDGTKWGPRQEIIKPVNDATYSYQFYGLSLGNNGDVVGFYSYWDVYTVQHTKVLRFNAMDASSYAPTFTNARMIGPQWSLTHPMPIFDYDAKGNMTVLMQELYHANTSQDEKAEFRNSVMYISAGKNGSAKETPLPTKIRGIPTNYSVAMGPAGHIFISWTDVGSIRAMFSPDGGTWDAPMDLSTKAPSIEPPAHADIDSSGRVTVLAYFDECRDSTGKVFKTPGRRMQNYSAGAWSAVGGSCEGRTPSGDFEVDDSGNILLTGFKPGFPILESQFFDASNPAAGWSAPSILAIPRGAYPTAKITLTSGGRAAAIYLLASEYKPNEKPVDGALYNAYGVTYEKGKGWSSPMPLDSKYPTVTVNGGVDVSAGAPTTFFWSRGVMKNSDAPEPQFAAY